MTDDIKLDKIQSLIECYGTIDGSHHKMWVLDQIMRIIKEDKYDDWVKDFEYTDEKGNPTEEQYYDWDKGIAP